MEFVAVGEEEEAQCSSPGGGSRGGVDEGGGSRVGERMLRRSRFALSQQFSRAGLRLSRKEEEDGAGEEMVATEMVVVLCDGEECLSVSLAGELYRSPSHGGEEYLSVSRDGEEYLSVSRDGEE